jgi:hypothetical protein
MERLFTLVCLFAAAACARAVTPAELPAPAGTLWHNSLATDSVKRSKRSPLAGPATRALDANDTAVPTRDGAHYATFEYSSRGGGRETRVWVKQTADGATLHTGSFTGYVRELRPSPVDPQVLLVKWGPSATSPVADLVVVDMAKKRILDTLASARGAAANWLPDGRVLLLDAAGALATVVPGGARVPGGRLAVAGRTVRGLWVDAQGSRVVTQWVVQEGDRIRKDLWISDADGAGLEQLTATDAADSAVWSPDGRLLAFTTLAEVVCKGFACVGATAHCELQFTSPALRGVVAGSPQAPWLRVPDATGKRVILGCALHGWTD